MWSDRESDLRDREDVVRALRQNSYASVLTSGGPRARTPVQLSVHGKAVRPARNFPGAGRACHTLLRKSSSAESTNNYPILCMGAQLIHGQNVPW